MFSKYAKAVVAAIGGTVEVLNQLVLDLALNADLWLTNTVTVVTAVATGIGVWWKRNAPDIVTELEEAAGEFVEEVRRPQD